MLRSAPRTSSLKLLSVISAFRSFPLSAAWNAGWKVGTKHPLKAKQIWAIASFWIESIAYARLRDQTGFIRKWPRWRASGCRATDRQGALLGPRTGPDPGGFTVLAGSYD